MIFLILALFQCDADSDAQAAMAIAKAKQKAAIVSPCVTGCQCQIAPQHLCTCKGNVYNLCKCPACPCAAKLPPAPVYAWEASKEQPEVFYLYEGSQGLGYWNARTREYYSWRPILRVYIPFPLPTEAPTPPAMRGARPTIDDVTWRRTADWDGGGWEAKWQGYTAYGRTKEAAFDSLLQQLPASRGVSYHWSGNRLLLIDGEEVGQWSEGRYWYWQRYTTQDGRDSKYLSPGTLPDGVNPPTSSVVPHQPDWLERSYQRSYYPYVGGGSAVRGGSC